MMTARSARGLWSNVYPSTTCWWQITIQIDSNNRRKSIVNLFSAHLSFYTHFFTIFFYKTSRCCGGNPRGLSGGTLVDQTWRRQPASNVPCWSTSPFSLCLSIAIHILLALLAFVNAFCTEKKGTDLPVTIIDLLTVVTKPVFWNLLLHFLSAGLAPCEFLRLCCNH